jgi:hypothetical protein
MLGSWKCSKKILKGLPLEIFFQMSYYFYVIYPYLLTSLSKFTNFKISKKLLTKLVRMIKTWQKRNIFFYTFDCSYFSTQVLKLQHLPLWTIFQILGKFLPLGRSRTWICFFTERNANTWQTQRYLGYKIRKYECTTGTGTLLYVCLP